MKKIVYFREKEWKDGTVGVQVLKLADFDENGLHKRENLQHFAMELYADDDYLNSIEEEIVSEHRHNYLFEEAAMDAFESLGEGVHVVNDSIGFWLRDRDKQEEIDCDTCSRKSPRSDFEMVCDPLSSDSDDVLRSCKTCRTVDY